MRTLAELPEDILYLVAETLERDRCSLFALARSCRSLHLAARPFIFRHTGELSRAQTQLLNRSLADDTSLKSYLHSYPVHIEYGEIFDNGLETSLELSNLRKFIFICSYKMKLPDNMSPMALTIATSRGRGPDQDFQCDFLDTYPFGQLRTIFLVGGFTSTEIMRFILLPSLNTVVAQKLALLRDPLLPSDFSPRKSNLTSLSLTGDGFWSIRPQALQTLLSACPSLQDLQCQIPVSALPYHPYDLRLSQVRDAVAPEAFNVTFASLRKSLRRLSFLQLRHNVPYDGTHMDLSQFENLVDLEITSCCLLPVGAPCTERNRLYKLLPISLERLMLDFPRESGIFFHHLEGEPFLSQDPSNIPESRYLWILELLKMIGANRPNLSHVTMQDPPGNIGFWPWNQIEWVAPEDLRQLMRASNIQLMVNISYPHPRSETETYKRRPGHKKFEYFPWQTFYQPSPRYDATSYSSRNRSMFASYSKSP
ncbi:hypothetical protein FB567DRAFT_577861 [Paraphoma chrysanthemicola]|uniref:F-box domain-containing protein n=1 Tax=Paraphoma chrysanthemicola TaxID=798071 RepID=A0A8K0RAG3_9PLEO|nr:hypothetical protein FB567DRAFT_577861 [Paraphoma chrysanthemicola]